MTTGVLIEVGENLAGVLFLLVNAIIAVFAARNHLDLGFLKKNLVPDSDPENPPAEKNGDAA